MSSLTRLARVVALASALTLATPRASTAASAPVRLLAARGMPVAGVTDKPATRFAAVVGDGGLVALLVVDDARATTIVAGTGNPTAAAGRPLAWRIVARSDRPLPTELGGERLGDAELVGVDPAGRVTFFAAPAGEESALANRRLWSGDGGGKLDLLAAGGRPLTPNDKLSIDKVGAVSVTADGTIIAEVDQQGTMFRVAGRPPAPLRPLVFPSESSPDKPLGATEAEAKRPPAAANFPTLKGMGPYALTIVTTSGGDRTASVWAGRDGAFRRVVAHQQKIGAAAPNHLFDLISDPVIPSWASADGSVALVAGARSSDGADSGGVVFAGRPPALKVVAVHDAGGPKKIPAAPKFRSFQFPQRQSPLDDKGGLTFIAEADDGKRLYQWREGKLQQLATDRATPTGLPDGAQPRLDWALSNRRGQAIAKFDMPRGSAFDNALALYTPGRGWMTLLAGGEPVEGAPAGSSLLAVETIEAFSNEWALLDVRLGKRSADPAQPPDKGVPALVLVPIPASPPAAPATRPSQRPPARPPNSTR